MFFRAIKEASSSPSQATSAAIAATTPSVKGSARKSRVPLPNLSDSDSSENEGTPIPTTHSQVPDTQSHIAPTDRLETSDRMSKEKQKFFRLSAFNADKKRDKKPESKRQLQNGNKKEVANKEPQQRSSPVTRSSKAVKAQDEKTLQTTKVQTKTPLVNNKQKSSEMKPKNNKIQNKPKPEADSTSSSSSEQDDEEEEKQNKKSDKAQIVTSSSSDCSSTDEESSETSDTDSESSAQLSESSSRMSLNNTNLKLTTMFTSNNKKMETFGSISGLNNDKDDVWGFAAAAAAAKQKEDKSPTFAHIPKKTEKKQLKSNSESERKLEKTKPGFGQLKGLFDGLSHLFAASTRSRNQNTPNYNLSRRKRNADKELGNEKTSKEQERNTESIKVTEQVEIVCNSRRENLDEIKLKSKQRDEIKLMESIRKASRNVASSHPLASTEESVVAAQMTQMTPSNLVKTAVNSKRHEFERRKFFKSEAGLGCSVGFTHYAMLEDARMKKRNLIAEATQTNPPLSVLPLSNNQTGKNGLRTHPLKHTSPL